MPGESGRLSPGARGPIGAKSWAPRQSGRSDVTVGRFKPPAKTISATPASRSRRKPSPAAPRRTVACGTSARMAGSASPLKARTKKWRSAARQAAMMRRGSSPAPANMPSLPTVPLRALAGLADPAARIGANELDDVHHRRYPAEALSELVDALAERAGHAEQHLEGGAQRLDFLAREAAALHADDIDAGEPRLIAHHRAVGNDVALDPGHAADHRMLADPDELMDGGKAADDREIGDHDVAGERRVVDHDDIVADLAVMRDMGADHEQAAVADPRHHAAARRAGIHRHVLADDVVAADDERGFLAVVFEILRLVADRREGEDPGIGADRRSAGDNALGSQLDAR